MIKTVQNFPKTLLELWSGEQISITQSGVNSNRLGTSPLQVRNLTKLALYI